MKPSNLRTIAATVVFGVVAVGLAFSTGLGTPSSFGWDAIATICPLGSLETMLAKWTVAPRGLLCLAITVVLVLVFGRAFCGWFCPTPLIRRIFSGKKSADRDQSDLKDVCASGCGSCAKKCSVAKMTTDLGKLSDDSAANPAERAKIAARRIKNGPLDSRHAVLIGALLSTAVFGFPVFCLVCPVGLSFATFIALWRLIQFNDATWSIVVFPLIIVAELLLMRKWCHRFCPLSALVSLVAKGNRTLRPTVDPTKCIREKGEAECHACFHACPEAIDLHDLAAGAPMNECLKCRECVGACTTGAITFPFAPAHVKEGTQVMLAAGETADAPTGKKPGQAEQQTS